MPCSSCRLLRNVDIDVDVDALLKYNGFLVIHINNILDMELVASNALDDYKMNRPIPP